MGSQASLGCFQGGGGRKGKDSYWRMFVSREDGCPFPHQLWPHVGRRSHHSFLAHSLLTALSFHTPPRTGRDVSRKDLGEKPGEDHCFLSARSAAASLPLWVRASVIQASGWHALTP